ncbi:hypothetical protein ACLSY9_10545, partial [Avibacterium avium]
MSKNYTVYLGSVTKMSYEENIQHCRDWADYLYGKGWGDYYYHDFDRGDVLRDKPINSLQKTIDYINKKKGNPLNCMRSISNYYAAQSSLDLLL